MTLYRKLLSSGYRFMDQTAGVVPSEIDPIGSTQEQAAELIGTVNKIGAYTDTDYCLRLPGMSSAIAEAIYVINAAQNQSKGDVIVYPAVGEIIDPVSRDVGVTIPPGHGKLFLATGDYPAADDPTSLTEGFWAQFPSPGGHDGVSWSFFDATLDTRTPSDATWADLTCTNWHLHHVSGYDDLIINCTINVSAAAGTKCKFRMKVVVDSGAPYYSTTVAWPVSQYFGEGGTAGDDNTVPFSWLLDDSGAVSSTITLTLQWAQDAPYGAMYSAARTMTVLHVKDLSTRSDIT